MCCENVYEGKISLEILHCQRKYATSSPVHALHISGIKLQQVHLQKRANKSQKSTRFFAQNL